ncbi:CSL zinc finger-domain-containing protein [Chaetomidium leptoderma]|uniref:Diphthamide biosynthesis protein 4 n=1 Tax=Chaetomidium leptoderma TaxID=669021 RepID=A0AAN6VU96_9PEZI|nr:CSL zinc finger-domain-containing protein [Chaetomidium leptoderma]
MAAAVTKNVQLALALPARLRTFLARYPPASILPAGAAAETPKTAYQEETPNPFMPLKHPATGRWHDPKYSLRRQAELVKMAREHGVEELLPYTPKGTEAKLRKRVELGLRVKGTGVGQKVKGHKHERRLGVKYVWVHRRMWLGCAMGLLADSVVRQDGQEETGHVGHAGAHPGMEKGSFRRYGVVCSPCQVANQIFSVQHHHQTKPPTHNITSAIPNPPPTHTMPPNPNPTYYEILNLSQSSLSPQQQQQQVQDDNDTTAAALIIKRAYRRALLDHHPDKNKTKTKTTTTTTSHFTIDQISTAYATLSRPTQRAAYDRSLLLSQPSPQASAAAAAAGGGGGGSSSSSSGTEFQTGIEIVDLDDLEYDEDDDVQRTARWYRPCRCGNPRGYQFAEADLEEAADLGELMVGCADCSLWLRVHFVVVDEAGEEEGQQYGG